MKHLILLLPCLLALSGVLKAEIPDPRDQHYGFAHKVMVKEMKKEEFLETLKKKKTVMLKSLWREAGKQARDGKKESSRGLDYKVFEVGDDKEVVVIILPEAEVTAEAHLVGALFEKGKLAGMVYTLEKGFEGNMLGAWTKGRRLNFGEGPKNDPEKFKEAILAQNKK